MQSLTGEWQDTLVPSSDFSWGAFQPLDMEYRAQDPGMYPVNEQYMTGVQH